MTRNKNDQTRYSYEKTLSWSLALIVGLLMTVIEQIATWFSCKERAIWLPNGKQITEMDKIYIFRGSE